MNNYKSLDADQQQLVIDQTHHYLQRAEQLTQHRFNSIDIKFDLIGQAAGMYCVRQNKRWIRYNPFLFAKYFSDNIANTIPHEVAHYIVEQLYGIRGIKPHGKQWRQIMNLFGAEPSRTCHYNLQGIPHRRQRTYSYQCQCRHHQLSARRHNRIQLQGILYICRYCEQSLVPIEMTVTSPN